MYKWSRRSVKNINTVHAVLQELAQRIIYKVKYDLSVLDNGGLRTAELQNTIFKSGNSKCDGYEKESWHQTGMAIDFVPIVNGKLTWNNAKAFLSVASVVFACWDEMVEAGVTDGLYLHWGGFWGASDLNNDGSLKIDDKLGWDMANYELRTTPQRNTLNV